MNTLEQLMQLKSLLIKENEYESAFENTRKQTDEVIKVEKPVYTDYKTYYKMSVNLNKIAIVMTMICSGIFILFIGLPMYFERYPAQNTYQYYGIPGLVLILICVLIVIKNNFKEYDEIEKIYLFDYFKLKYEHIAIPIGLSILLIFVGIGFMIPTALVEVSDTYWMKVEEVMNIAVLNAVISAAFMIANEIGMTILIPIRRMIIKFMPRFRKERKAIDNHENNQVTKYDGNIAYYQRQLKDIRRKIKENRVISYKYKNLEFVRNLIYFYEKNPNASYRYALNYVIIDTQIKDNNNSIKMQEKKADMEIRRSFEKLEDADIEFRATINTYNKLLSENRMRESYMNQQGRDELKKYIDRHTK